MAASSIALNNYNDNTGAVWTTMEQNKITAGQNSNVYNGIQHQTISNRFVDIVPGVSFEATKANTPLNTNTISVSEDKPAVKKLIADLVMLLMIYLTLLQNSKLSRSIVNIQFADPNESLSDSSLLAEVQELFDKLFWCTKSNKRR